MYFYIFYLCLLFFSQYIFFSFFNVFHADHLHYLEKALEYKNEYGFLEIISNIFFSFSSNINLPLIFFYAFFFKLLDSTVLILFINTLFTLIIFNKINKIILLLDFNKINLIEFFILTSFLTYFNIGINKEIIAVLILLYLIHEVMKLKYVKNKNLIFFNIFISVYLFSLIKPLHAIFILLGIIIYLICYFAIHKKKFYFLYLVVLIILFSTLISLVNNRYNEFIPYFNIINIYDYINIIRTNIHKLGLTNSTLSHLSTSNELFDTVFFSINNFYIIIYSFLSSIIFPSINDLIFAIYNNSRYILFIFLDSILMKIGICYSLYILIKERFRGNYLIIIGLFLMFSLILSIVIPNDGISYRYLYPYKFIFIFIGYGVIKRKIYSFF